jgi:PQQ-dependent catabolism-associated CXXCW motif protein
MKGVAVLLAVGISAFAGPALAGTVAEPDGYRMGDYRAPVPASLAGARVVTTDEAHQLWRDGKTVFIDVMPHTPKPANLPEGTIWRDKERKDIPGSIWLANVGYGAIPPETESYFRDALAESTGGDRMRAILFYCMTDCWMSWNAAKRAIEWGYASAIWYPFGSDGWEAADLPLEQKKPYAPSNGVN